MKVSYKRDEIEKLERDENMQMLNFWLGSSGNCRQIASLKEMDEVPFLCGYLPSNNQMANTESSFIIT